MLLYLATAVLLCAAFYLISNRRHRKSRATLLDAEKSVAMMPRQRHPRQTLCPPQTTAWGDTELKTPFEADQQAASAQLLDEFAAAFYPASEGDYSHGIMNNASLPGEESSQDEEVVFVNPKQYHRILKRRVSRQAWAEAFRLKKSQGKMLRRPKVAHMDGVIVAMK